MADVTAGLWISAVVISAEDYPSVRKLIGYLRAQSIREHLELVIVAPAAARFQADPAELDAFGAYQVVEVSELKSAGYARAMGVRHARAPLVAFCEEHCYPAPGWAEALVAAHRQPGVAVVAPAFHNANPQLALSWADFLVQYGPYLAPVTAGDFPDLPGHNSCYKREALAGYDEQLEHWLEMETLLHLDLAAKGCRLYLEPQARVFHLNMSRLPSILWANFITGRFFASARARTWPLWRRLAYAAAWPLVALVRLRRVLKHYRRLQEPHRLAPGIPLTMALLLIVSAWGESVGNLAGPGNIRDTFLRLEWERVTHLAPGDEVIEPA